MSKRPYFKQFSLALVLSLVPFDPYIESNQVLPLRAKVDLWAMATKEYATIFKAAALQEPRHHIA